jgi:hypothetical protein
MTNEQFDSYKTRLLRELQRIQAELATEEKTNATLDLLISDIKSELKKP